MVIQVYGISHKTASVGVREKAAFLPAKLEEALLELKKMGAIMECLILSTCNRVEIYVVGETASDVEGSADFFSRYHNIPMHEISRHIYCHIDVDAIRHIFRVACGLESMVLGETQILGQVRSAFVAARNAGAAGNYLAAIFEEALKVGNHVRNVTGLNHGAVSAGSVAVQLAKNIFTDLVDKTALIIGAGKMGEATLRRFTNYGVDKVFVMNRTHDKAVDMASRIGGIAVEFFRLNNVLENVDIVISSVNAPHAIIGKETVSWIMRSRSNKPLFLIDIAVPRNVDRRVRDIKNVHVYDIDDLERVSDENMRWRKGEAVKAETIIEAAIEKYLQKEAMDVG